MNGKNKKEVAVLQDLELLKEFKHNAEQALGSLIDQYADLVYSIIHGKIVTVGTSEDVQECVSDVFLEFYKQVNKIDTEKGTVKAYLAIIAKRKGIDLYRKLIRVASHNVNLEEEDKQYEDRNTNIEQSVIQKEEQEYLLKAMDSLGEPDREIFIRKYYMGQKTKEIATALNLLDNTVDKKVSRGLKKLRILLGGVDNGKEDNILAK